MSGTTAAQGKWLARELHKLSFRTLTAQESPNGRGVNHALWMLEQIEAGRFDDDLHKMNRWIGYAQAIMVEYGLGFSCMRDLTAKAMLVDPSTGFIG